MYVQQQVQIIVEPALQRALVEALDQLLDEQSTIGQRAGEGGDRHQRGDAQFTGVVTRNIGQVAAFIGMPAMFLINVQIAHAQLRISFGQCLQRGLKPMTVIQRAGLDQAQVASAQSSHQQRQFDVPVRSLDAHHGTHRQGRLNVHSAVRCLDRTFG